MNIENFSQVNLTNYWCKEKNSLIWFDVNFEILDPEYYAMFLFSYLNLRNNFLAITLWRVHSVSMM